jgi:hypothetical protein
VNKLSPEERSFFEKLTKDRESIVGAFARPAAKGVEKSVVEKYSDQAHFVYELLQNADDAKATQARFILKDHGLYFLHDGSIHFSISDPEKEDKSLGNLGHINSITSIGNSQKDGRTIGKFGVGFKAVFQYTETPHIYDPHFWFKIERLIVPKLLNEDLKDDIEKKETDTVFYFPFDKIDLSKEKACSDIYDKLETLVYPTLFLPNLNEVSWRYDRMYGKYYKILIKEETRDDIRIQLFDIFGGIFGNLHQEQLWLLSRHNKNGIHSYSIGYFLDKNNKLKPDNDNRSAFCFFPTKEKTGLKFIMHAPFSLTDNRAEIRAGDEWNLDLISKLSKLAADSLMFLKEKKLLDDNIFDIIPHIESVFSREGDNDNISFMPFYTAIKEKFKNEDILPSRNGEFANKNHAYWAESAVLSNLFSNEQLAELVNDANAKWVFTSIGRTKNPDIAQYIDGGDERSKKSPNLIKEYITPDKILNRITRDFIQRQYDSNPNWLHQLYEYLQRTQYKDQVKSKPIFINTHGRAVSAFDDQGQPNLFLPTDDESEYTTIHKDFLDNEISRKFFGEFGIKCPSLKDEINKIFRLYNDDSDNNSYISHFRKIFKYYKDCPNSEMYEYLERIRNKRIVQYKLANGNVYRDIVKRVYMPSDELRHYFETKPDTYFLDIDYYYDLFDKSEHKELEEFFLKLGVRKNPKIFKIERVYDELDEEVQRSLSFKGRTLHYYDKKLDGCKELINKINKEKSLFLWNQLISIIVEDHQFPYTIQGERNYSYYSSNYLERFDSTEYKRLTRVPWIFTKNGEFITPHDVNIDDFSDEYDISSDAAKSLISFLGIKDNSEKQMAAETLGLNLNVVELIKNNPDSFKKWVENIKVPTNDFPKFPQKKVTDTKTRRDFTAKTYDTSEEKRYEKVEQIIRVSSPPVGEKKQYYKELYTNDEGVMVCQICEREMPFKKLNKEYYFVICEITINTKKEPSEVKKEATQSYLALCPTCAAKYNVFVHTKPEEMSKICTLIKNTPPTECESTKIPVSLDKEQTITFVAPHLLEFKTILERESQ